MTLHLEDAVELLHGVGPSRAKGLKKLGITTLAQLIQWYPRSYEDRRGLCSLSAAPSLQPVCVRAMVAERPQYSIVRRGLDLVRAKAVDDAAVLHLTYFNQPHQARALVPGQTYVFYGTAEGEGRLRRMTNPITEPAGRQRFTGRIMPIYPLTAGITNHLMASWVSACLSQCAPQLPDPIPPALRAELNLLPLSDACQTVHFPPSWEALSQARHRLVFQELFLFSLGLALFRQQRERALGLTCPAAPWQDFFDCLPFAPTDAQRRVIQEAAADLSSGRVMTRLIQGDVGAGKTVIAAACAWQVFSAGGQTALMAPTEILAQQHAETLSALLAPLGMETALLTGSLRGGQRQALLRRLAQGEIHLLVGTHALLSKGVEFARLGLVVTDEQHRFGVAQRAALSAKGESAGRPVPPHVLVMSATPIPRTLALILYGDLDISVLDGLPPGRRPVETHLIGEDKRARLYAFVRRQAEEGRQVYIICPAVEEQADAGGLKAVTAYTAQLRQQFPDLQIALVHGKMKPKDKEQTMSAFRRGEISILVSTTVVEVGVDVPNAALMVVENAERFGLSQLHQLRGRVGRGGFQAYCVLISDQARGETLQRLQVLCRTGDGFQIAEEDLKLRGPGDFLGQRQHGLPQLKAADLAEDVEVLHLARQTARQLLEGDPSLSRPEHACLLAQVQAVFADAQDGLS